MPAELIMITIVFRQYGSVKAKTLCQSQFFLRTTEAQRALREESNA